MNNELEPITYGVYVRRSTDNDDRQVQSLVRQEKELQEIIDREGLVIYPKIFQESASAFVGERPVFDELVEKTEKGEINAWLCWHINRLTRNATDSARIVNLIDNGQLNHVRTIDRTYQNDSQDKIMIQIGFIFSKNDSEEKSKAIRSGLRRRVERGYPLGNAPLGFTSVRKRAKGDSWIEPDHARLELIRQVFDKFLKGKDSIATITSYARAIGLTTIRRGGPVGRLISRSCVHAMLTSSIYAGYFYTPDGKRYELADELPRIVTEEELTECKLILGERGVSKSIRRGYFFPFYGLIFSPFGERLGVDPKFQVRCDCRKKFSHMVQKNCPHCGAKVETLKKPIFRSYRYYFSRRSRLGNAPPIRSIEERKVRSLLADHIRTNISFPQPMLTWALKHVEELQDKALRNRRREARERDALRSKIVEKRKRLRELYLEGQIEKSEFEDEMKFLNIEANTQRAPDFTTSADWKEEAKKMVNLSQELVLLLEKGNDREIHQAIKALGITMIWDGEDLHFKHSTLLSKVLGLIRTAQYASGSAFSKSNKS